MTKASVGIESVAADFIPPNSKRMCGGMNSAATQEAFVDS
jgi:hypothetical protein